MADIFTKKKRSSVMARIRSRGNLTTELRVVHLLRKARLKGWRRHLKLPGNPDLVFPDHRVAVYIHGCFWHGCSRCSAGHIPKTRRSYWLPKLERTKKRDNKNRRSLRSAGYRTVVVWEHELLGEGWLKRIVSAMELA